MRPTHLAAVACLWLAAGALPTWSDSQPQCTHEIVPTSHWTYLALRELTSGNRVVGLSSVRFLGDFAFDRSEMAAMAWTCWEQLGRERQARSRQWLGPLLREFTWELESAGLPVAEALTEVTPLERATIEGHGLVSAEATNHGARALGSLGATRISRRGDAVGRLEYTRFPADATQLRVGRPALTEASLEWLRPQYRLTLGRTALRTGVGARGTFNWDDTHGPTEQARYESRWHVLGTHVAVDFSWTTAIQAGRRVSTISKRFEKRLSDRLEFSVTDTARAGGITSPVYIVSPLSFWASLIRSRIGRPGRAFEEDNLMMHTDLTWSPPGRVRYYLDGAVDEVDMPALLDAIGIYRVLLALGRPFGITGGRPGGGVDENAWLLGAYSPDLLGRGRWAGRMEYAWTSRYFGLSTRSESLDFFDGGVPLQHRIGPDASSLYLELRYLPDDDWTAGAFVERTVRGRVTPAPEREWALGVSATKGLGRGSALRVALTHRQVRGGSLTGVSSRSTTLSGALQCWF
jgi:hypothetical protein